MCAVWVHVCECGVAGNIILDKDYCITIFFTSKGVIPHNVTGMMHCFLFKVPGVLY